MKERAVLLGKDQSLMGIVTNSANAEPTVGIILLNSGLLHRVGPNRFYVRIVRTLAEDGFICLRFDLAGIGDSKPPSDPNYNDETGAVSDILEAMNYLTLSKGIHQFVLIGLCSGADNAFRAACTDERVVGVVMLEAFSFPTDAYFVNAYKRSIFSPKSWVRFLSGQSEIWGLLKARFKFHTSGTKELTANLQAPPREQVLKNYQELLERKVRLCFIYASGGAGEYHYKKLLHDAVEASETGLKPNVVFVPGTDHLFTMSTHQNQVLALIKTWSKALSGSAMMQAALLE